MNFIDSINIIIIIITTTPYNILTFIARDCARTAIIDSVEMQPLYESIVDFMDGILGMKIPSGMRSVPVLAVDLPSLNEQRKNSGKVFHSTPSSAGIPYQH